MPAHPIMEKERVELMHNPESYRLSKCEIPWCRCHTLYKKPLDIGRKNPLMVCYNHYNIYSDRIARLKRLLSTGSRVVEVRVGKSNGV